MTPFDAAERSPSAFEMTTKWALDAPIYQQLANLLADGVLDGVFSEGAALPSAADIASTYLVHPRTVARALQVLKAEAVIEIQTDRRWHVQPGAHARVVGRKRDEFLVNEWPTLRDRLRRLGLEPGDLLQACT